MRIYVIRHADPDYENGTITALGHQEAEALSERLDDVRIDRIYSSPKGRAVHTAEYTAKRKGLEIEVLDWLAEVDWWSENEYNGHPLAVYNAHGFLVREMEPQPTWGTWHENEWFSDPRIRREFEVIQTGSDLLMADHGYVKDACGVYRHDEPNEVAIAVFCHNGLGLTWLAHLLNIPLPLFWTSFYLRPASLTTVLMDERDGGKATPRCLNMSDETHLVAKGLDKARVPNGIVNNYE
ncbi:bifunctional RNase H/acid phosphatase [Poriferisphaera corsica]|uniref:Bifunctional RNase H/acid phosphatase n=1 Tax=Poriferisphaera corsica TaxID=2528020 RepID=A0A517YUS9_9BACT|nr:histidine phosphatase family protein [Poriferisphaera corsica]QDU33984.1 bifunctional RNase H/acid phosphatase [Poriferisphaera corsica]